MVHLLHKCRESCINCFSCFILLQGKDGFLGRCVISPMVRLEGHQTPEPRLQWHKIRRGEEEGGELLAACELFLVSLSCFMFYILDTVTVFFFGSLLPHLRNKLVMLLYSYS